MSAEDRDEDATGPQRPVFRSPWGNVTVNGLGSSIDLPRDNPQARAEQGDRLDFRKQASAANGPEISPAPNTRDQGSTNPYQTLNEQHAAAAEDRASEENSAGSGFFAKAVGMLGAAAVQASNAFESLFASDQAATPEQKIEIAKNEQAFDPVQGQVAKQGNNEKLTEAEQFRRDVDAQKVQLFSESDKQRDMQQQQQPNRGDEREH